MLKSSRDLQHEKLRKFHLLRYEEILCKFHRSVPPTLTRRFSSGKQAILLSFPLRISSSCFFWIPANERKFSALSSLSFPSELLIVEIECQQKYTKQPPSQCLNVNWPQFDQLLFYAVQSFVAAFTMVIFLIATTSEYFFTRIVC